MEAAIPGYKPMLQRLRPWCLLWGGLLLLSACIEVFEVDVPRKKSILLVEGMMLDDPRHQYVKLFLTNDSAAREPVSFATVRLKDGSGKSVYLTNTLPGEYRMITDSLPITTGQEYQLEIMVGDSIFAVSDWQTVPVKTEVQGARLRPGYRSYFSEAGVQVQQSGVELLVSTAPLPAGENHIRWDYEVTYGYIAPQASPLCALCGYCYITENPKGVNQVTEAAGGGGRTVQDRPVDFIPVTEKFNIRYTVLVKQYSISKDAFDYYAMIERLNNTRGNIFDPPPAVITGNIINKLDPEATVYGFFEVGTYSETSTSIVKSELPFLVPPFLDRCLLEANREPFRAFDCFDCRAREGASTDRPYYY